MNLTVISYFVEKSYRYFVGLWVIGCIDGRLLVLFLLVGVKVAEEAAEPGVALGLDEVPPGGLQRPVPLPPLTQRGVGPRIWGAPSPSMEGLRQDGPGVGEVAGGGRFGGRLVLGGGGVGGGVLAENTHFEGDLEPKTLQTVHCVLTQ